MTLKGNWGFAIRLYSPDVCIGRECGRWYAWLPLPRGWSMLAGWFYTHLAHLDWFLVVYDE